MTGGGRLAAAVMVVLGEAAAAAAEPPPPTGDGAPAPVTLPTGRARIAAPGFVAEERTERPAGTVEDAPPSGTARLAGVDMAPRHEELRGCRSSVALERGVPPQRVRVGRVEVRWTVLPDGGVARAEVVAPSPTDTDVLTCIKRVVAGWRFPPAGGPEPAVVVETVSLDRR